MNQSIEAIKKDTVMLPDVKRTKLANVQAKIDTLTTFLKDFRFLVLLNDSLLQEIREISEHAFANGGNVDMAKLLKLKSLSKTTEEALKEIKSDA